MLCYYTVTSHYVRVHLVSRFAADYATRKSYGNWFVSSTWYAANVIIRSTRWSKFKVQSSLHCPFWDSTTIYTNTTKQRTHRNTHTVETNVSSAASQLPGQTHCHRQRTLKRLPISPCQISTTQSWALSWLIKSLGACWLFLVTTLTYNSFYHNSVLSVPHRPISIAIAVQVTNTLREIWLLVCQSRGLHQTHADVVKEVRPQKHACVCSEGRTVMCLTVLMQIEVRTPPTTPPWRAEGARLLT